jgi:chromosome partitioning protein
MALLQKNYSNNLWNSVIPVDTKIRDASLQGIPAPILEPDTKAVLAYAELLQMLLQQEKRQVA